MVRSFGWLIGIFGVGCGCLVVLRLIVGVDAR